jgi:predicted DsbA family dithiol-disulfide isomerase
MDTQLIQSPRGLPSLEFDLIADLACPWSYMGKRSLERALGSLWGTPIRARRWHGFPLAAAGQGPVAWREHLASRLPQKVDVEFAHRSLTEAGRELGISFDFDRLQVLPDTREAHRLVWLAGRDNLQSEVVDAVFAAFFQKGQNIADPAVLRDIAAETGLGEETRNAFADPQAGASDIASEEKRLRGLGVTSVPNLLINGRILVPGPADVSTYVQALDQALFPSVAAADEGAAAPRLLH